LQKIYDESTNLRLKTIHSGLSLNLVKRRLKNCVASNWTALFAWICLAKLRRKSAIHAPHKSLEATLQFIGRFARPGENLGKASLLLIPTARSAARSGALSGQPTWQTIVANLSETRIAEQEVRSGIEEFEAPSVQFSSTRELSYALKPFSRQNLSGRAWNTSRFEWGYRSARQRNHLSPTLRGGAATVFITREFLFPNGAPSKPS
jgi:hypothetical protein